MILYPTSSCIFLPDGGDWSSQTSWVDVLSQFNKISHTLMVCICINIIISYMHVYNSMAYVKYCLLLHLQRESVSHLKDDSINAQQSNGDGKIRAYVPSVASGYLSHPPPHSTTTLLHTSYPAPAWFYDKPPHGELGMRLCCEAVQGNGHVAMRGSQIAGWQRYLNVGYLLPIPF